MIIEVNNKKYSVRKVGGYIYITVKEIRREYFKVSIFYDASTDYVGSIEFEIGDKKIFSFAFNPLVDAYEVWWFQHKITGRCDDYKNYIGKILDDYPSVIYIIGELRKKKEQSYTFAKLRSLIQML